MELKFYFLAPNPRPPGQPLLTLMPPSFADPDTSVWSFIFVFFPPEHSISQEDVWLSPLAALQIKRGSPPCSWWISAEMHSCVFSSLSKSVFLPLCPSNQGWARKDCLNTLRRDKFWKKKIKVLSERKGRVLFFLKGFLWLFSRKREENGFWEPGGSLHGEAFVLISIRRPIYTLQKYM